MVDLNYLKNPVSKIISPDATIHDLIESYCVLTARLRATVTASTDGDASWPLFQPFRRNRELLANCIIRDLGKALVDPQSMNTTSGEEECIKEQKPVLLPSPKNSPKKKRGTTAEKVKYARDLCTASHSVLKLLGLVFTIPAVYNVFDGTCDNNSVSC